jgi:hypothetical protein
LDELLLTPSRWREFCLAREVVCDAIKPPMGLSEMIQDWGQIRARLAESPRKRRPQMEMLQTS